MAGRASIVGAVETSIGNVRDHNEDAHFIDPDAGIFIVCDGMGGHAAGEVASALAVQTIRTSWASDTLQKAAELWLAQGTPDTRKELIHTIQHGVVAAHDAILAEAGRDRSKGGMGTTVVGAVLVGGDVVFAHCGDSRAYLVRDGIAMQLTEDHTLLARLLAAGIDVDVDGDGLRFKSMLTNALGIGDECKVSTFVVPVADGDRLLLCSDGITEYVKEHEIGEVLSTLPSPARSAQRLVEMALARGGGDNATALVVRVLEAGESPRPAELLRRDEHAIHACPLWAKVNPQQRLRALRIALPREYPTGDKLPAQTLGDRVAWIVVEGTLLQDGHLRGPGSLIYPEALLADRPLPDKNGLAVAQGDLRALALRNDDFRELCDDDPELGEALLEALAAEIAVRRPHRRTGKIVVQGDAEPRGLIDPGSENTPPAGTPAVPRPKADTDRGLPTVARPPAEPPERVSSPRLHARGSTPPSSLIATPSEVAGDVDRALDELTTQPAPVEPHRLAPADDEDAEIVVEARAAASVPASVAPPAASLPPPSEPEISIERLEEEAASGEVEPELAVEPLVVADSGPVHPRPKRHTDAPE